MRDETLYDLGVVIGGTARGIYWLWTVLPLWGQVVVGIITVVVCLRIGLGIYLWQGRVRGTIRAIKNGYYY